MSAFNSGHGEGLSPDVRLGHDRTWPASFNDLVRKRMQLARDVGGPVPSQS